MAKYLVVAKSLLTEFRAVRIKQVGRDLNSHADTLVGLASVFEGEIGRIIVVDLISALSHKIQQESILVNTELRPSWMDPIVKFLRHEKLSKDKREVHKLRIKVA